MGNRATNPLRRWKRQRRITYSEAAEILGITESYARKLGAENFGRGCLVSPKMALQFERRSAGEITFRAMMRWIESNLRSAA